MRLRIDLAYDGGDFRGWASQPGLRTVQGELTNALTTVLRLPAGSLQVTCAGRTDRGLGSLLDRQRLYGQFNGSIGHCPRDSGLLDVRHDLARDAELRFLKPIGQPVGNLHRVGARDPQPHTMAFAN